METRIIGTILEHQVPEQMRAWHLASPCGFRGGRMLQVKNSLDYQVMTIKPGAKEHSMAFSMLLLPLTIT